MKDNRMIYGILLAVAAVNLHLLLTVYSVDVETQVGIFAILGLSLILMEGHANYFKMGHSLGYAIFIIIDSSSTVLTRYFRSNPILSSSVIDI